jgi:outer membrane autotransporter protein
LSVAPSTNLTSAGPQGGPFSPSSQPYTLENTGLQLLFFTVTADQPWIDVSTANGSLNVAQQTTVTVSINANANALAPGNYSGTVTFTNTSNGTGTTTRTVALAVQQQAPVPANGQIVLRVLTGDGDGTFSFTSATAALQVTLATNGGSGQTSIAGLLAGAYAATLNLPGGFVLQSASCSDADSTVDVTTRTASINLQAGETVVCTFETSNARKKTSEAINRFLAARADLLMSNEPGGDRQIDRLVGSNGTGPGGNTGFVPPNTFAPQRLGGPTPGFADQSDDDYARNGFAFAMSLQQVLRASEASRRTANGAELLGLNSAPGLPLHAAPPRWDIWVQGNLTNFNVDGRAGADKGHFGLIYAGADYLLSPRVLVGALVQFDSLEQRSAAQATRVSGNGWMAGPYTTIRLTNHLFLQARSAWGTSDNKVSPYTTYQDDFETQRGLARGGLVGHWQWGPWQFRPQASIAYLVETQKAYVDSLGIAIPGQTVALGQAKFGPEVAYRYRRPDGTVIEPRLALEGIWNFDRHTNSTLFISEEGVGEELRGRVELGVRMTTAAGMTLGASASYDGLGSGDYSAVSGRLLLTIPLR